MLVNLEVYTDHVVVTQGGVSTKLLPGDSWRGWHYQRLRDRGSGSHELAPKPELFEAVAEPAAVPVMDTNTVLTLRGHK